MSTNLPSVIEQLLDMADSYATDVSYLDKMKNSHDSSLHDIEQASWAVNGSKSALENALTNALAAGKQALEQTQALTEDEFCALQYCEQMLAQIESGKARRSDEAHFQDFRAATIKDASRMAGAALKRVSPVFSRLMNATHPQATEPAPTPFLEINYQQAWEHKHEYHYFGTVQSRRRCIHCNELEPALSTSDQP